MYYCTTNRYKSLQIDFQNQFKITFFYKAIKKIEQKIIINV